MKEFYITWDEKRNGYMYSYAIRKYLAENLAEVKEAMRLEQAERKRLGRPHMFHLSISRKAPEDIDIYKTGHLYY